MSGKYDYMYQQIINEKMGHGYIHKVNIIKNEQCFNCQKNKTNKCRLDINGERCVNYEKMDKRNS